MRRSYDDKPCEQCGKLMQRIYFYEQSSAQRLVTAILLLGVLGKIALEFAEIPSSLEETMGNIVVISLIGGTFITAIIEEKKPRTYRCVGCQNIRQKPPFVYQSENFQSLVRFFFIILGLVGIALVWMLYSL